MSRQANDGRGRMGGRAKGTKNKPKSPIYEWAEELVNRRRAQFEKDLDALTPNERASVLAPIIAAMIAPRCKIKKESTNTNEEGVISYGDIFKDFGVFTGCKIGDRFRVLNDDIMEITGFAYFEGKIYLTASGHDCVRWYEGNGYCFGEEKAWKYDFINMVK